MRSLRWIAPALCLAALRPGTAAAQSSRLVLGSDTASWMGVSGQARVRGESWTNFGAGAPSSADHDDAFALTRLLLRGELHVKGAATVVAELKSSLAGDRTLPGGRRPSDEDEIDIQQLYAEGAAALGAARFTARAGRFDLALGRERLVSPLDWTNSRRAFQGASARLRASAYDLQAFWVRPIVVRQEQMNRADTVRQLYGAQVARGWPGVSAELYWLRNETRTASINGTAGSERRHTLGYRLSRRAAPQRVDFDVEMAWQTGSLGGQDVNAFMVGSQAGYSFKGAPLRIYGGFDLGTGDHSSGGSVQTFNQLFPLSHAYLGYIDVHGRQNVASLSTGAVLRPARDWSVQLDGLAFQRASSADGLYAADGSVARQPGSGLSKRVGEEIDLTVRRSFERGRLILQGGASRYFAGPFLRQTGPADNITWAYGQVTATF